MYRNKRDKLYFINPPFQSDEATEAALSSGQEVDFAVINDKTLIFIDKGLADKQAFLSVSRDKFAII